MACTYRDSPRETLRDALAAANTSVVTAPESVVDLVAEVAAEADASARIVTEPETVSRASWPIRGRLTDVIDRGGGVRTAPEVDTLAVVGPGNATTVMTAGVGVVAWVDDDPTQAVVDRFERVWDSGEPATLDGPGVESVTDTVAEFAGSPGVDDLRRAAAPTRSVEGTPSSQAAVRLATWAAAAGRPSRPKLIQAVADTVGCSERTVERALSKLVDGDLVATVTPPDGEPGASPARLCRRSSPPLSGPELSLLRCQ